MNRFTTSHIAKITGGKLFSPGNKGDLPIERFVTDSRTYLGGNHTLFFALKGPRNDGHRYIPGLIKRGLDAFVVSDENVISDEACFILVENTTAALQKLAAFNRKQFNFPVLGITGSNGKTIVKEWLYELLSGTLNMVRSPKSYNSQIGVPLSVLLIDRPFDLGIIEAGISQPGEMARLAGIISPEWGIFTNIGDAHQENFSSRKQKTREKLHLFTFAESLVFSLDDKETAREIQKFCQHHTIKEISWSLRDKPALIRFREKKANGHTTLSAWHNDKKYLFQIPFTDHSAVENACHCFAAATLMVKDIEKILPRFEQLAPVAMRLEIKKGMNNCLLINDFYNSDLTSLSIALSVLHQQAEKGHLKKQVILSDIRQTGLPSAELYQRVNQLLEQWKIDELTGIGPEISAHSHHFSMNKSFFPSTEAFCKHSLRNLFSGSAILIKGARAFTFEKISALLQQKTHQTVLEISLNALVHNLNVFRGLLHPQTKIMVMVKAFSYGSGDVEVARMLQYQNVDYLAVAVADEGVELRQAGIQTPIIVMNPEEDSFQNMLDFGLEPNIYELELWDHFEQAVALNALKNYPVHLKLDTGMNRLGLKTGMEIEQVLKRISSGTRLKIKSVFSHLAASDDPGFDLFTQDQMKRFEESTKRIAAGIPCRFDRHILNSAGIERFPEKQYEMVRLGIGLYGISVTGLPLENISTFRSTVSQVKKVHPDETIGYGRQGQVTRESEIAVVPVGYADGLDRKLGNGRGQAFIKGQKVPIVGNICMDMLMLDVTGLHVMPGDDVEFFGPNLPVAEVAEKAGTIPYEILTGISQRVKRIYLQE